jgi:hypothetical protein
VFVTKRTQGQIFLIAMCGTKPQTEFAVAKEIATSIEIVLSNFKGSFCPEIKLAGSVCGH